MSSASTRAASMAPASPSPARWTYAARDELAHARGGREPLEIVRPRDGGGMFLTHGRRAQRVDDVGHDPLVAVG